VGPRPRAGAAGRAARGAGRARGPAAPLFSPLAAHVTNGDTILRLGITMCTIEPVPRPHSHERHANNIRGSIGYMMCAEYRDSRSHKLRSARQPLAETKPKSATVVCPSRERDGPSAAPPVRRARRPSPRRRRWLRWLRCSSSLTSEAGWRRRAGRQGVRGRNEGEEGGCGGWVGGWVGGLLMMEPTLVKCIVFVTDPGIMK